MKTIQFTIKEQTFKCKEEKAKLIEKILYSVNIKHSIKVLEEEKISESVNSNVYILERYLSGRAFNTIKMLINYSPEVLTIKDFAEKYNLEDVRKIRNCGKETFSEIREALHKFGFIYW